MAVTAADRLVKEPWMEEYMMRTDLAYFAEKVLGLEISAHHKEWSRLAAIHMRLALNAPRDHGKSYMFTFAYVIWRAYFKWIPPLGPEFKSIPKISLGYIFSSNQDNAIRMLEQVKEEIESNPKLAHLVPQKKETWSKMEIKLANGAILRARGWGNRVRGAHPVWIVCDDVLNDESIYSEVTRMKELDYFYSAITPMLVPGGQMIIVGTPFHVDDLYAKLAQNPTYYFKRMPALSDGKQEPLWPTRYNKQMLLQKISEVGSTRFSREYLCLPISDGSSLFPEKVLESCYDPMFEMPTQMTREDRQVLRVFTGVDLALSSTVGADYTVITTIGVDQFRNRWILDIRRKKGLSMMEQLREIQDVHDHYKSEKILIESNGFQRVFRDELVRNTTLPVQGFTTTAQNKNSLESGIPSLQILFENRKFMIGRKTERDRRLTDPLIQELKCFTWSEGKLQGLGAHDDTVMSLWIAHEAANQSSFSFAFAG